MGRGAAERRDRRRGPSVRYRRPPGIGVGGSSLGFSVSHGAAPVLYWHQTPARYHGRRRTRGCPGHDRLLLRRARGRRQAGPRAPRRDHRRANPAAGNGPANPPPWSISPVSAAKTPVGLQPDGLIVSRCGLVCNTCTAFMTGACPGCHALERGECVIRDCADLRGTSCLDCEADACYHFEAYAIRRSLMNSKAKRFYRLLNGTGGTGGAAGSGCGGCCGNGGCGRQGGGCRPLTQDGTGAWGNGCAGCPAARMAQALAARTL